jgi:twinkle protein
MAQAIPAGLEKSKALQYITQKGWNWQGPVGGQVQLEVCPYCKKSGYKCYVAVGDPAEDSRDGLHFCHFASCGATGNLRKLQEHCGDRIPGVDSRQEWAGKGKQDELPNIETLHAALLNDPEVLDYLLNVRGFTQEVIERQKLGLKEKQYFRECGEVKALVFPYLVNGNCVFAKYRSLPPSPKAFASPTGWEAPLYNGEVLNEDCTEIVFLEGEADALALLSKGIENVVGVPGANVKKASWIELIDKINPKIYICYDSDQAGTKGAQDLASRIGLEKCLKITLPKGIKDINAFFQAGNTVEDFEKLKANASLFPVNGVTSSIDALSLLEDAINGKVDLAPTYVTQFSDLNKLVGLEEGDILDIIGCAKQGKSTMAMNLLDHLVKTYNEPGLFCCLEMIQARLARKWVSMLTGFEDTLTAPGTPEAAAKLVELKRAIVQAKDMQQSRQADLYFSYPQNVKEPEDIFKLIRDCIRRYGVKFVVFDNLQRLCDDTLGNKQGFRTIQLSQISKGFAKLAKDHKIVMIRIVQPKKIDKAAIVTTADVDGSSQIDKDADAMITIWRAAIGPTTKSAYEDEAEENIESNESFSDRMRVTVGLSRYSSGGHCFLKFEGATSRVRDWENPKPAMQQNFNSLLPQENPTAIALPTENII